MRERLVVVLVGLTALVIGLYGVPRAYFLADLVEEQETQRLDHSADLVASLVTAAERNDIPVTEELLAGTADAAESVEYDPGNGKVVSVGDSGPDSESDLVATRRVANGGSLTLRRSGDAVSDQVAEALLPLVLLGLVLLAASALAAMWLARRLSRPFQELSTAAEELGRGQFDLALPHYRIPEADRLAIALTESGRRLESLIRRERELAVHASHELRTPMTALRLELEDLAMWPQTAPEVAAELRRSLTEVDRLSVAVTELLEHSRDDREDDLVVVDLARSVSEEALRQQSGVTVDAPSAVMVRLPARAVNDLVRMVVTTAGGKPVSVARRGDHATLRSPGTDQQSLDEVRNLAAALGGSVVTESPPASGFEVRLPSRGASAGSGAESGPPG